MLFENINAWLSLLWWVKGKNKFPSGEISLKSVLQDKESFIVALLMFHYKLIFFFLSFSIFNVI